MGERYRPCEDMAMAMAMDDDGEESNCRDARARGGRARRWLGWVARLGCQYSPLALRLAPTAGTYPTLHHHASTPRGKMSGHLKALKCRGRNCRQGHRRYFVL